jgi:predicted DNA-binding transcriptional regulator AlpA
MSFFESMTGAEATMSRQDALPSTLPPRLINREAAAAYVSLSPNKFDELVKNGGMPRPKRLSSRRLAWDVRELDIAVDRLPNSGDEKPDDDTWDDVDAP